MNEDPHETPKKNSEPPAGQDSPAPHREEVTLDIDKADKSPQFLYSPQVVSAGRGGAWFSEGWQLFMRSPILFSVMGILATLLFWVLNLVPLVGNIAVLLFWPHIGAGFYLAYQHAYDNQPVNVGDLFEPFKEIKELLILGSLYLAGSIVITIIMAVFILGGLASPGMLEAYLAGEVSPTTLDAGVIVMFLLGLLTALALSVILAMAFIFAPILIHQHRVPALEAVKQSFNACWYNFIPFLIWGLIWTGLMLAIGILSLIPVLGWLLLAAFIVAAIPLSTGNLYLAYRDIFLR